MNWKRRLSAPNFGKITTWLIVTTLFWAFMPSFMDVTSIVNLGWAAAARKFASLAGWLAGARRAHLREAWLGDLRSDPDSPNSLSGSRALRAGLGYLVAALRFRLQDLAKPLLWLLDAVLTSATRTRWVNSLILAGLAAWLWTDQGFNLTIGDVVAFPILWGALDKSATRLRRARNLPEPGAKASQIPDGTASSGTQEPPNADRDGPL